MAIAFSGGVTAADVAQAVAARVNGTDIYLAEVKAVAPSAAGRGTEPGSTQQTLQALIDEQLLVQQAESTRLDRDPQVMVAIQDARRAVLVKEWMKRTIGESAPPSDDSIAAYYDGHPSRFAERRLYSFRVAEVAGPATQLQALQQQYATAKALDEVEVGAQQAGLSWNENAVEKTSDQIPEPMLRSLMAENSGDHLIVHTVGDHLEVAQLISSKPDPVDLATAKADISHLLVNEAARTKIESAVAALKAKASIQVVALAPAQPPPTDTPSVQEIQGDIAHGLK